jgi:hypothetical protein
LEDKHSALSAKQKLRGTVHARAVKDADVLIWGEAQVRAKHEVVAKHTMRISTVDIVVNVNSFKDLALNHGSLKLVYLECQMKGRYLSLSQIAVSPVIPLTVKTNMLAAAL